MDGVGWGGVAFIWLSFLWPVVSTALVYALKSTSLPIRNKAAYWLCSIVGGYVSIFVVGSGIGVVAVSISFSNEMVFVPLTAVFLVVSAAVPFGVALYVAKKCS